MSITLNASTSSGFVQSADNSGQIELQSNGTTALKVNTNEGIQILNCLGVGNATPSTSGAGITFPATQSASTDGNTLDDYEEGTWSPTCSSNAGSITSYTSAGQYTKIGRMVYLSFNVAITNAGTGSSGFNVSNLPFAIGSSQTAMGVGRENANTGNSITVQANSLSYSSTSLLLYYYNNNTVIATSNNCLCSVAYYV